MHILWLYFVFFFNTTFSENQQVGGAFKVQKSFQYFKSIALFWNKQGVKLTSEKWCRVNTDVYHSTCKIINIIVRR